MKKVLLLSVLILCLCHLIFDLGYGYPWPFRENDSNTVEQKIRDSLGSRRRPLNEEKTEYLKKFHNGVDIVPNIFENISVYPCIGGKTAYQGGKFPNQYIRLGTLYYVHIDERIGHETPNVPVTKEIGRISQVSKGGSRHLHLQEYNSSFAYIINPLDNLDPFSDSNSPTITTNSIEVHENDRGGQFSVQIGLSLKIYGRVDISAKIKDTVDNQVPYSTVNDGDPGCIYPYQVGYQILKDGQKQYETMNISFKELYNYQTPPYNAHLIHKESSLLAVGGRGRSQNVKI